MFCLAKYTLAIEGFAVWAGHDPYVFHFTYITHIVPLPMHGFCSIIYLDYIMVIIHSKHVGKRAWSLCGHY